MSRIPLLALVLLLAVFLAAGGCIVPTRHGPMLIAPVPHGVIKVRTPPPPIPHVPRPTLIPAPVPVPHVPSVRVVAPPSPRAGLVWIDGHHVIEAGVYVWRPGSWVRPPRPGAVWVAPRTVKVGHEWRHTPGYWK